MLMLKKWTEYVTACGDYRNERFKNTELKKVITSSSMTTLCHPSLCIDSILKFKI